MSAHRLPDKEFLWTSQLAWAVGLLVTDGCLSNNGKTIILRSSDLDLLELFKAQLNLAVKIGTTSPGGYSKKDSYRIQFGGVQLYRWLLGIGLTPAKTYTIGAVKIPDKYFRDFLRGHLDGDGSITTYKDYYNTKKNPKYIYNRVWLRFISVSQPHIMWLRARIFELTGLKGHTWIDQSPNRPYAVPMHVIKFGRKDSIKLLNWMYYNPDVPCLERKRQKAEQFLEQI